MKFSNTIKTVLKIYQKYAKFSVWFGTGSQTNGNRAILVIYQTDTKARDAHVKKVLARELHFLEINRYFALTSYRNAIGLQSYNAFSIY